MAASYPSSVKTFGTKLTNDVIEASHINDIQDETSAVEGGLINGLAHTLAIATNNAFGIGTSAKKWLDAFVTTFKAALGSVSTPSYTFDGDPNTGMWSSGADLLDFAAGGSNLISLLGTTGIVSLPLGQLKFPATANPSTDVNILDDYEEGTWTPVIGGSGGSSGQTYAAQLGNYVKVGKMVTAAFTVTLSAKGTITGNVEIQGLPFASEGSYFTSVAIDYSSLATNWVNVIVRLSPSVSVLTVMGATAAAANNNTNLATADISNTTQFIGVIRYRTAT